MAFTDSDEFKRGSAGERIVSDILQGRGWYVVPASEYSGWSDDNPPRMRKHGEHYAIPDLDIAKGGHRYWVEVKTKKEAIEFRKAREIRHGFELHLYDAYQRVAQETGTPVWLVIVEESTGEILTLSLNEIPPVQRDRKRNRAYFRRDDFKVWSHVSDSKIGSDHYPGL